MRIDVTCCELDRGFCRPTPANFRLVAIVFGWFLCSVITEVFDKHIMNRLGAPLTLCTWKFVASIPCGVAAVFAFGSKPLASLRLMLVRVVVLRVLPLAAMIVGAKLFTYISYGRVPLSTAQIVKAATPIVTVLMTRFFLGERFGLQSYLSLLPIAMGVCLAVGVDIDFNVLGVLAALASCVFAAGQAVYMKALLNREHMRALLSGAESHAFDALTLNLLCAVCCSSLLLPLWLGVQAGLVPTALDGGRLFLGGGLSRAVVRETARHGVRLWTAFFVGALTQYGQSMCAYLFVEAVSPATYQVIGTARKPFIVLVAVVCFRKLISPLNLLGIALAFAGVFWYQYARYAEKRDAAGQPARDAGLVAAELVGAGAPETRALRETNPSDESNDADEAAPLAARV